MPRTFSSTDHIRNVLQAQPEALFDDTGARIARIAGFSGARGETARGEPIGLDRVVMEPGTEFPLHTHQGDHMLYVLAGSGAITVEGVVYELVPGDSIFVAAEYPHGVRAGPGPAEFEFIAIGIPHREVSSTSRMHVVRAARRGASSLPPREAVATKEARAAGT